MAQKKKTFPDAGVCFELPVNEHTIAFFKRMHNEHVELEQAFMNRIKQLFDEHIEIGGEDGGKAYNDLIRLFALGYRLGWNEMKNVVEYYNAN